MSVTTNGSATRQDPCLTPSRRSADMRQPRLARAVLMQYQRVTPSEHQWRVWPDLVWSVCPDLARCTEGLCLDHGGSFLAPCTSPWRLKQTVTQRASVAQLCWEGDRKLLGNGIFDRSMTCWIFLFSAASAKSWGVPQ